MGRCCRAEKVEKDLRGEEHRTEPKIGDPRMNKTAEYELAPRAGLEPDVGEHTRELGEASSCSIQFG